MRDQHIPAGCPRPALFILIAVMGKLSGPKRNEIARLGGKAKAAKHPRIRRLTREVTAEARRLSHTTGQVCFPTLLSISRVGTDIRERWPAKRANP